ncbi:MAG: MSMEG_4193 family putative phosphomutase [Acidimicrobiia bacterium]
MPEPPAADGAQPDPSGTAPAPGPAPPATRVVLVRHAVTAETGPILSGRRPGIDLSETGRGQADGAARRLAGLPVSAVYSSPLERCRQTADAVASHHDLKAMEMAGLAEADYGDWTGQKIDDLRSSDLWKLVQTTPSAVRFPRGESVREMQARIITALEEIVAAHPGELVVAVSHADPIKAAVAHFTGVHLDLFQRLFVAPASCTVLRFGPTGAALVKLNDTGTMADLVEEKREQAGATTDA